MTKVELALEERGVDARSSTVSCPAPQHYAASAVCVYASRKAACTLPLRPGCLLSATTAAQRQRTASTTHVSSTQSRCDTRVALESVLRSACALAESCLHSNPAHTWRRDFISRAPPGGLVF